MPLDLPAFTKAFNRARHRIQAPGHPADVAAEQEGLRAMVPPDASEHDREWTANVIAGLADPTPEREWSALYHEAGRILAAAYPVKGTVDEQIEALADARRRISEIADRASDDEEPDIRAMTQGLAQLEELLHNPPFPLQDAPSTPSRGASTNG
jgi:hypothetical protein